MGYVIIYLRVREKPLKNKGKRALMIFENWAKYVNYFE